MTIETPNLGGIHSKSLRAQVLSRLRDAILEGEFKPGQPLNESLIATELGVSRAPLREALQTLQAEGLVELVPYRHATVRALTKSDLEELYSLRSELEIFAIRRFMALPERPSVQPLRLLFEVMAKAAADQDVKGVNDADLAFHEMLIRLSGHKLLLSMWQNLAQRVRMIVALRNRQNRDYAQVALNHIPIIDALDRGDEAKAAKLLRAHIATAADLSIATWQYAEDKQTELKSHTENGSGEVDA